MDSICQCRFDASKANCKKNTQESTIEIASFRLGAGKHRWLASNGFELSSGMVAELVKSFEHVKSFEKVKSFEHVIGILDGFRYKMGVS